MRVRYQHCFVGVLLWNLINLNTVSKNANRVDSSKHNFFNLKFAFSEYVCHKNRALLSNIHLKYDAIIANSVHVSQVTSLN